MKRSIFFGTILSLLFIGVSCKKVEAPAAFGPVPTENQMRWQEMEYYAFIHFSLYNSLGVLVYSGISNNELLQFEVGQFKKGMYLIRIKDAENSFTTTKIILE